MVSLLVGATNRRVVTGTVSAVVFIRALTIALESNTITLSKALILISSPIDSTFRSIDFWAVSAVRTIEVAKTIVLLPDAFAM